MSVWVFYCRKSIFWARARGSVNRSLSTGLGEGVFQELKTCSGLSQHELLWGPDHFFPGSQWGWKDHHFVRPYLHFTFDDNFHLVCDILDTFLIYVLALSQVHIDWVVSAHLWNGLRIWEGHSYRNGRHTTVVGHVSTVQHPLQPVSTLSLQVDILL